MTDDQAIDFARAKLADQFIGDENDIAVETVAAVTDAEGGVWVAFRLFIRDAEWEEHALEAHLSVSKATQDI